MTEYPILFSGAMVKAVLSGAKTQTRRVVKLDKWVTSHDSIILEVVDNFICVQQSKKTGAILRDSKITCPYGVVGDQLWVRETICTGAKNNPEPCKNHIWRYFADNEPVVVSKENETVMRVWAHHKEQEYCPSIHMPRWASRIQLEITDVRVQRVQDISESDAMDEGSGVLLETHPERDGNPDQYRKCFHDLWDSINSKRGFGWKENPWVWAISFKRIEVIP